jgi:Gram-negative bacterial TonB protein C-terminal
LYGEIVKTDVRYDYELIRRYWSGEMTNAERYALEKAALEDPMLADAMDGYANRSDLDVKSDLADLQSRLATKPIEKEQAPVVQMKKTNWMRYAAALLFTVGVAALLFRLNGGGESEKQIAQIDPVKKDSVVTVTEELKKTVPDSNKSQVNTDFATTTNKISSLHTPTVPENNNAKKENAKPAPVVTVLTFNEPKDRRQVKENMEVNGNADYKSDSTLSYFNAKPGTAAANEKVNTTQGYINNNNNNGLGYNTTQNLFRGRVLDNSGQALPFAKIKINDQLSTYTDVSGNFILVSSDTTMTIEVKSVGYVANQTSLFNRVDNNVQLQEDKIANTQVIATNTNNYRTKRKSAMRSEMDDAPQPQDGWTNYDAYLANNIDVEKQPSLQKIKGEVEVEVEVNAEGTVVNAAVTKSLCEKCDAEAIRLVKEGPKWKGKKGRKAKVLVRF